jgi:hypothetical protein
VDEFRDRPFALIGVHVGGSDVAALKSLMTAQKLPWRSFVDLGQAAAGPIARSWNSPSTPTLFVLDTNGVIRHKWVGKAEPRVIEAALRKLLESVEREGEKRK